MISDVWQELEADGVDVLSDEGWAQLESEVKSRLLPAENRMRSLLGMELITDVNDLITYPSAADTIQLQEELEEQMAGAVTEENPDAEAAENKEADTDGGTEAGADIDKDTGTDSSTEAGADTDKDTGVGSSTEAAEDSAAEDDREEDADTILYGTDTRSVNHAEEGETGR